MSQTLAPPQSQSTSVLAQIGNTPLLKLERVAADLPGVELYAKAEYFNPGGSVKDRPAWNMIQEGERAGLLTPQKTIIDATSGNTGIAYAMIGSARGYKVKLFLPANASEERKKILKAYGAELILTDPAKQTDGAIEACREAYDGHPEKYFYPNQYGNPANWQAHFKATGPEIWEQTGGRITHFVTGLGTSGTFMGVGRYLREKAPHVQLISMQPATGFHGLEGLKHMATAMVPEIYDAGLANRNIEVETEDAYTMVKRLAREEGMLVGISSGANVVAALQVARKAGPGVYVTVFCDGADKYLSDKFWEE
ncbi:MAG: cysteine synthase family protein [Bryobacterales bacterium]|nr:cysteine synthase family protein [Bryobacterales bacterium]